MKGTIVEFLKLAVDKPELAKDLIGLAAKHDFEFTDEVNDEELDGVAGGFMTAIPSDSPLGILQNIFRSSVDAMNSDKEAMLSSLADQNEQAAALGEYLKDNLGGPPTKG